MYILVQYRDYRTTVQVTFTDFSASASWTRRSCCRTHCSQKNCYVDCRAVTWTPSAPLQCYAKRFFGQSELLVQIPDLPILSAFFPETSFIVTPRRPVRKGVNICGASTFLLEGHEGPLHGIGVPISSFCICRQYETTFLMVRPSPISRQSMQNQSSCLLYEQFMTIG